MGDQDESVSFGNSSGTGDDAKLTILIAARNAAATIARALDSCLGESVPVLLINDRCSDETTRLASLRGGDRLRIIDCPHPGGLPNARQAGLDAVSTMYAAWLDADDEWIPGRALRLITQLDAGADVVVDALDLHDGESGVWLRRLEVPKFLRGCRHPMQLFERNYLPGDTQVGFRVSTFRAAGGYDKNIFGPESFDLLLRSLMKDARFAFCAEVGYRMYAYPESVSRDLSTQRQALRNALLKYDLDTVARKSREAGYSPSSIRWTLVSMAMFREEWELALDLVGQCDDSDQSNGVLPLCPRPGAWGKAFFRGTAYLMLRRHDSDAAEQLRIAQSMAGTAEVSNNLGVALRRLALEATATSCFEEALRQQPAYRDAKMNLANPNSEHVTTHPLRRTPSRFEYSIA